ncbi:MAG TPA: ABC transporter permease [Ignavibacteriaceae bacterium]|nr:ABC transporter permease [Ignavibacteriaceae bacterium]
MFNFRTMAVIKRELREKIMSKTFIIMTLLLPVFMFGIMAFQTFLLTYDTESNAKLIIVTESPDLTMNLQSDFSQIPIVKQGKYIITFQTLNRQRLQELIAAKKQEMLDDKLNGIIFIPSAALTDKKIEYYSKSPSNSDLFDKLKPTINQALVDGYFHGKQLSQEDIEYARNRVDINGFRISKDNEIEETNAGARIISFVFAFLLYFSLMFIGMMMMRSVVEEKNSKIVEILLSSVEAKELMVGKIIGTAVTGLLQMAIWMLPIIVVISSSIFVIPPELIPNISIGQIIYFLFNYFVGLITFLGLFATVGAIFDNDQDAQSGIWPIMMLIMIPFFISISMNKNPNSVLANVTSLLPFSSIMVMPARMSLVDIPAWQFATAIVVNVGMMLLIFPLAGKIYRIGILLTGKKPKWGEVIKWLRYK